MASLPKSTGVSAEEARQLIVKAFADLPDVVGIALAMGSLMWRVKVITNHGEMYDHDALDPLIEREYVLLQELDDLYVDVDYLSQGSTPLEKIIPIDAILIYRR
jgi:hypothetical protein